MPALRALLIASFLISGSALAGADEVIKVQGRCETKVVPDRIMITFTAENQSKDQKLAFKKTSQQIESLKEKIKAMKLKDLELKNTGYNVYPVREYEKERMVDKGMKVSLSLQLITSEIEKIGDTLAQATQTGITNVGTLQTFLSQEKTREEYLKCLEIAAKDASIKAQHLARQLNVKVGKVVQIIESPLPVQPPIPVQERGMMFAAKASMDAPTIEAGQQDFSATIQVSYRIK